MTKFRPLELDEDQVAADNASTLKGHYSIREAEEIFKLGEAVTILHYGALQKGLASVQR